MNGWVNEILGLTGFLKKKKKWFLFRCLVTNCALGPGVIALCWLLLWVQTVPLLHSWGFTYYYLSFSSGWDLECVNYYRSVTGSGMKTMSGTEGVTLSLWFLILFIYIIQICVSFKSSCLCTPREQPSVFQWEAAGLRRDWMNLHCWFCPWVAFHVQDVFFLLFLLENSYLPFVLCAHYSVLKGGLLFSYISELMAFEYEEHTSWFWTVLRLYFNFADREFILSLCIL